MGSSETMRVNFWRHLLPEQQVLIRDLHGRVLIFHNSLRFPDVVELLNIVRPKEQLIVLYLSLTSSCSYIRSCLEEKPLVDKELFVVDCVSGFIAESADEGNCFFRKPVHSFREMKDLLKQIAQQVHPNMVVVDALSRFVDLSNPRKDKLSQLNRFFYELKTQVMNIVLDTVVVLYDNPKGVLLNLPSAYTDVILRYEVVKDEPDWID